MNIEEVKQTIINHFNENGGFYLQGLLKDIENMEKPTNSKRASRYKYYLANGDTIFAHVSKDKQPLSVGTRYLGSIIKKVEKLS